MLLIGASLAGLTPIVVRAIVKDPIFGGTTYCEFQQERFQATLTAAVIFC
jgi:hypothetical protein